MFSKVASFETIENLALEEKTVVWVPEYILRYLEFV